MNLYSVIVEADADAGFYVKKFSVTVVASTKAEAEGLAESAVEEEVSTASFNGPDSLIVREAEEVSLDETRVVAVVEGSW